MQKQIKKSNSARIHYDTLTKGANRKVLGLYSVLPFHRFSPTGKQKYVEDYYDTADGILASIGLALSKVYTKEQIYFKLEEIEASKTKNEKFYYIEPCAKGDAPIDKAISITGTITEVLKTNLTVDLANLLRKTRVNMRVQINSDSYTLISGSGLRALVNLEQIEYINTITKKTVKREGVTTELSSELSYLPEFKRFTDAIGKYVKELVPHDGTRYNIIKKLTR